jgi:hypothetical protein
MSNQTLATAGASSGHTINKPALVLVAAPNAATDSSPRHSNIMSFVLASLGESFMSWQQVAVIAILVLGGCFLGAMEKETLAATILGAAAGFISQPLLKPRTPETPIVNNNPGG